MLVLAVLMLASSYSFAQEALVGVKAKRDSTLQELAYKPDKDYSFQVGDTIVIPYAVKHYLTGEEPSGWVYLVRHTIQQIGGKRFPNGILVGGIYSWIGPDDAYLVGTPAPKAEGTGETKPEVKEEKKQPLKPAPKGEGKVTPAEEKTQPAEEKKQEVKPEEGQTVIPVIPVVPDKTETTEPTDPKRKPAQRVTPEEQQPAKEGKEEVKEDEVKPAGEEKQEETAGQEKEAKADEVTEPTDTVKYGQVDRFTIGLRGGMATYLQSTTHNTKPAIGGDVLLDLQYAHYWQTKQDHLLGLLVGVSAGFAQGGLKNELNDTYTKYNPDDASEKVIYTVTADKVKEDNREIQLEIPIMFSYIFNSRFFLNVGPRLMLPVYTPYTQNFKNPNIDAYFEDWGVHVQNELATGKLTDTQYKGKSANKMNLNILLGLELGYEWTLKNKNSLGLGVYANYDLYNTFKQTTQDKSLVDVAPAVPTTVDVNAASEIYTKRMGYLDAGLKIAYHFNWWKK